MGKGLSHTLQLWGSKWEIIPKKDRSCRRTYERFQYKNPSRKDFNMDS